MGGAGEGGGDLLCVTVLEPRSAIGEYDAEADRLILRLGCQGVFGPRNLLSSVLGVPVEKLRVLTGNVGGSFGMKSSAYPEYICLLYAARTLGRPVKWTDELKVQAHIAWRVVM